MGNQNFVADFGVPPLSLSLFTERFRKTFLAPSLTFRKGWHARARAREVDIRAGLIDTRSKRQSTGFGSDSLIGPPPSFEYAQNSMDFLSHCQTNYTH